MRVLVIGGGGRERASRSHRSTRARSEPDGTDHGNTEYMGAGEFEPKHGRAIEKPL